MSLTCFSLKNTVIVGVGNLLRGDDAIGPLLVQRLQEQSVAIPTFDVGGNPEDFVEDILALSNTTTLEKVLVVDCAGMGLPPGSMRLMLPEQVQKEEVTSHKVPIHLFVALIRRLSPLEVYILGVEPQSIEVGSGLSPEIAILLEKLLSEIVENTSINVSELTSPLIQTAEE
jgi:hydrogenase 3 maturation protease